MVIETMSGTRTHRADPPSARGAQPETWANAVVEIVDERDRRQDKAATNDATDRKAADATGSCTGDWVNSIDCSTVEREPPRHLQKKY